MSGRRIFFTPPWKLSNEDRGWLRSHRSEADRYEAKWRVVLF